MKKIVCIIALFVVCIADMHGQDDFFTNVTVGKNFKKEQWTYTTSGIWKHIYDEVGWSRIGVNGGANYAYKNWTLLTGFTAQYTFDKEIVNSVELRPWVGVRLRTDIIEGLNIEQEVHVEWRNFLYHDVPDENYIRTTFDVGANYNLKEINLDSWAVQSGYVWYFLKDPALGERYADSREFRFLVSKTFTAGKLTVGYKREKFKILPDRPPAKAHTLDIMYVFN